MGAFNTEDKDYCIRDILSEVRLCLQAVVAGNKKMVMENDNFKVTCYTMGSLDNIRIDIKSNT